MDVKVFPVADIGYNPYTTVLATSGAQLKSSPERAQAMVAAVLEGWGDIKELPLSKAKKHKLKPFLERPHLPPRGRAENLFKKPGVG